MQIDEVGPGVFSVRTPLVNWYLLRQGRDLTLVDGGYPGDGADVLASIERIGHRWEDVRAVLVTHAHVDHVGGLAPLLQRTRDVAVLLDPLEVAHARREHLQQVGVGTVLAHAWQPRVALWAARALQRGGTRDVRLPAALPFASRPGALDVPGAPVPVPTHGHTDGHSAFLLPEHGIVLTGDALVTGHPTSAARGPRLLPAFFHHDLPAATDALHVLADLDADVVLPGHGPVLRLPVRTAAASALARAGAVARRPR